MHSKIWLSSPHMGQHEFPLIEEAFDTNWIAPLGPHVDKFELELQNYVNSKHAAALSSGTAALHLALILLGVTEGDEVICQSFTFSASANPIAYLGAMPIFIDSEIDTWNMCPQLLEKAIIDRIKKGKKPKAIIPVHLYGMPAKIFDIMEIATRYDIPVVEDAAESLGSTVNGQAAGTFSIMSIISFNGNKIITTGGGGALISNDENYIKKAKFLATQAKDNAPHYQHSHIGYNYRMSNVCAAIGCGQILVLNDRVMQRRRIYDAYFENFSKTPGITFLPEPMGYKSNRWLTTILVDATQTGVSRDDIIQFLSQKNIESRPLWKPMHMQPVFKNCPAYINGISELLFKTGLCLPSGSNLTAAQLERVIQEIKNVLNIKLVAN